MWKPIPLRPNLWHCDDLGSPDKNFTLHCAGEAREMTLRWKVEAVGWRTIDHIGRDLLFYPPQNDGRAWKFRWLLKNVAPWLYEPSIGLGERDRVIAARVLAIYYLHTAHLLHLQESVGERAAAAVRKAVKCFPCGMLVAPQPKVDIDEESGDDPDTFDEFDTHDEDCQPRVCSLSVICPFCFAKKVARLYTRLVASFASGLRQGFYFTGEVVVDDLADLDSDPEEVRQGLKMLRKKVSRYLREQARRAGVTGGIVTFTAAPKRCEREIWSDGGLGYSQQAGLTHRIALLGQTTGRGFSFDDDCFSPIPESLHAFGDFKFGTPRFRLVCADEPAAFRQLLTGGRAVDNPNGKGNYIPGAFCTPTLWLANSAQWEQLYLATYRMRLFHPFGAWRGIDTVKRRPKKDTKLVNADVRLKKERRLHGLHDENSRRHQEKIDECIATWERLKPFALTNMTRLSWRSLVELAVSNNIELTTRNARRLAKHLKMSGQSHAQQAT